MRAWDFEIKILENDFGSLLWWSTEWDIKPMRVFVVTMLFVSEWEAQRTESRVEAVDFHAVCVHAVERAIRERGRVLSITEIKQQPKLVS